MALKGSLSMLQESLKEKVLIEIEKRLIPLYQGTLSNENGYNLVWWTINTRQKSSMLGNLTK